MTSYSLNAGGALACRVAVLAAALAGAGALPLQAGVKTYQQLSLQKGWNAVYLTVTPDETADELFASWPVESVGFYNPSAFLETKQFSSSDSTEGASRSGYLTWRRGEPGLSPLQQPVGNGVYVCYATNVWTGTIYGRPVAPRLSWHPSGTNAVMNLVGFSLAGARTATLGAYFDGFTGGSAKYYHYYGNNAASPSLGPTTAAETFSLGDVVAVAASKVSDWSGVLYVSPMTGLNFSTNATQLSVSVRNDSTKTRQVKIRLAAGNPPSGEETPNFPVGLLARTGSGAWTTFDATTPFAATLGTNETVTLEIALDRSQLSTTVGTYYGGILRISDETEDGSGFATAIPLEITSDGGVMSSRAWPKGVWLGEAKFTGVTFFGHSTNENGIASESAVLKSRGTMKVRLPMYVDDDGKMTLLQRFWYGSGTNNMRRISTPFLPIDNPEIAATNGTFGTSATFDFVVDETSAVNPYRHALHPLHDGKSADYSKAAPSGDTLANYAETTKPELFSVTNRIVFTWSDVSGTAWTPQETVKGKVEWYLSGVRHEGEIKTTGSFAMRRILSGKMTK